MSRITLTLDPIEKNALSVLAEKEFRDPRAQAALIIRQELERRGLLIMESQADSCPFAILPIDDSKQEGSHVTD